MPTDEAQRPEINPTLADDGSLPYPLHQVVSIFSDADAAIAAVRSLGDAGFAVDQITVFYGDAGVERLTATAEGGSGGWVTRALRTFGGEQELIREYEEAVQQGEYLVFVPADGDEQKHRARDVLHANGGRAIRYYARGTVEHL